MYDGHKAIELARPLVNDRGGPTAPRWSAGGRCAPSHAMNSLISNYRTPPPPAEASSGLRHLAAGWCVPRRPALLFILGERHAQQMKRNRKAACVLAWHCCSQQPAERYGSVAGPPVTASGLATFVAPTDLAIAARCYLWKTGAIPTHGAHVVIRSTSAAVPCMLVLHLDAPRVTLRTVWAEPCAHKPSIACQVSDQQGLGQLLISRCYSPISSLERRSYGVHVHA